MCWPVPGAGQSPVIGVRHAGQTVGGSSSAMLPQLGQTRFSQHGASPGRSSAGSLCPGWYATLPSMPPALLC
jgi:hypothetical protein